MTAAPVSAVDRPRVGVSSCLLGAAVRYDGGDRRNTVVCDLLGPDVDWVPVCPEVEAGLGVPREPMQLVAAGEQVRLVTLRTRIDLTAPLLDLVERRVGALAMTELDGYLFKARSPSCGLERVPVRRRGAGSRFGRGLFAAALTARLPDLPVEEEGNLADERRREGFTEQVFAHRRWRSLVAGGPDGAALAAFHEREAAPLRRHSRRRERELRRLVAVADGSTPVGAGVLDAYRAGFMAALRVPV